MLQTAHHETDRTEHQTAKRIAGLHGLHAEAERLGIAVEHLAELVISESSDALSKLIAQVAQVRFVARFEVS